MERGPYEYQRYHLPELKHMLRQRQLKVGGTKPQVIDRLKSHDKEHLFHFLKLPHDIRFMIYRLIIMKGSIRIDPYVARSASHYKDATNFARIMQPALFQTCRSVRMESMPLFMQRTHFRFWALRSNRFQFLERLLSWYGTIGPTRCSQIRRLSVWIPSDTPLLVKAIAEDVSSPLSDEAHLSYITWPEKVEELWRVGEMMLQRGSLHKISLKGKVPHFNEVVTFSSFQQQIELGKKSPLSGQLFASSGGASIEVEPKDSKVVRPFREYEDCTDA